MRAARNAMGSIGGLALSAALAAGAVEQEAPAITLRHLDECGLVQEIVSDDAARADAAARELAARGPATVERALRCAIFEAGPSPEDIVMIEFDPVRSAKLDKALAGIARMGRPSVPELSRLVAAGGVVGALAAATLGSIGPDAASAAPNLLPRSARIARSCSGAPATPSPSSARPRCRRYSRG